MNPHVKHINKFPRYIFGQLYLDFYVFLLKEI